MKTWSKIFLIPLSFFALEKLIRTQTDGFRLEKTQYDTILTPKWDSSPPPPSLNQSFHFLGSGVQSYAFLGEDGETVLKIFKHYHLWPSSKILTKMPLSTWREKILKKRQNRLDHIFSSAIIAYQTLPEQTKTLYLNLNPAEKNYPLLTIYDKIGIRHTLDLNQTPFLLQKKADLLFTYLKQHPDETTSIIDSLFDCLRNRFDHGIINTDAAMDKNFGVIDGKVVEIDIGSFKQLSSQDDHFLSEMGKMEKWFAKHRPEALDYFKTKRLEVFPCIANY